MNGGTGRINVALLGSGGREHAIAWKLRQSNRLGDLFAIPGNPGIAEVATNVQIPLDDFPAIVKFCKSNAVGLVVVGPEDPLAEGVTDALRDAGIAVFGPKKAAARLEGDKAFAKDVMRQASVPTAEAKVFTDPWAAENYVRRREVPLVVKAAGLAKGKGVSVCYRHQDAIDAINAAMRDKVFGDAGRVVVIEEFLEGVECSVLALVDRRDLFILELCQDHKPVGEGNTGPMTGGMGAFCPADTVSDSLLRQIETDILVPMLDGLGREGVEFSGCLYAGLMLTAGGPKVLEFNVRFGDPETQPLMMRWKGDLLEALLAVAEGRLAEVVGEIGWDERASVCVVLASRGYPGKIVQGVPITGVAEANTMEGVQVFHSGTAMKDGKLVTAGGRVLTVTALGDGIDDARKRAYEAVGKIHFDGMHFRRDIGEKPSR